MQARTTELYITSICHQIIIHECYLNDRVLTNVNICFSPSEKLRKGVNRLLQFLSGAYELAKRRRNIKLRSMTIQLYIPHLKFEM